jgi:hypothetical protein
MADPSLRQLRLTDAELTLQKLVNEMKEDIFRRLATSDTSHETLLVLKGEAGLIKRLSDKFRAEQNKP